MLQGEAALVHDKLRPVAAEAHPAVVPGVLGVGGIGGDDVGVDEEPLPGGQPEPPVPHGEGPLPGKDAVDQVVVPDGGAEVVAAFAVLKAALAEVDVPAPVRSRAEGTVTFLSVMERVHGHFSFSADVSISV